MRILMIVMVSLFSATMAFSQETTTVECKDYSIYVKLRTTNEWSLEGHAQMYSAFTYAYNDSKTLKHSYHGETKYYHIKSSRELKGQTVFRAVDRAGEWVDIYLDYRNSQIMIQFINRNMMVTYTLAE